MTLDTAARGVPWMGLGENVTQVDGLMTARECIKAAKLDWTVRKEPLFFFTKDEEAVEVQDRFGVVRSTDQSVLGTVGSHYTLFQNRDAFSFTDHLVEEGAAVYEAAFSLRGGRQIGIVAQLPRGLRVGKDEHELHLLFRTSHDGSKAVSAHVVVMAIRCTNYLTAAVRGAKASWSIPHVSTIAQRVAEAKHTLGLTKSYVDEFRDLGEALLAKKVTDKRLHDTLVEVLPRTATQEDTITGVKELRASSPNILGPVRGTGWGAYNALTEFYDWHRNTRSGEGILLAKVEGINARARNRLAQELIDA